MMGICGDGCKEVDGSLFSRVNICKDQTRFKLNARQFIQAKGQQYPKDMQVFWRGCVLRKKIRSWWWVARAGTWSSLSARD